MAESAGKFAHQGLLAAEQFVQSGGAQAADNGDILIVEPAFAAKFDSEDGRDADEPPAVDGKRFDESAFDGADGTVFGDEEVDELFEILTGFGG